MHPLPPDEPTYWLIDDLNLGVALRQRLDEGHIKMLTAVLEQCPAILVTTDGGIVDGRHRVEAARRAGWVRIPATVLQDGQPGAELLAAMVANASHGLPLSRTERRAGVRAVLERRPDLSDRAVAQTCGVARTVVAAVRAELDRSGGPNNHLNARTGTDGKRYARVDPAVRKHLESMALLFPDLTVRELARACSVSVGTAQAHRARVVERSRGEGVLLRTVRWLHARWILWTWTGS